MIFTNTSLDSLVILFSYMFIYNISLICIFWTLHQFISTKFITLFSFSDLKFNFYFVTLITIILFSIAGVPPFIGFFSKILLLILLSNSNFFFFYIFFFGLLFFGLYFYLQNIRFLYSTGFSKINYSFSNSRLRISILYFNYTLFLLFIIIFGLFFMDDVILYFYWLFS
jgi:NADH-quinone oxidoreductase subunit N